MLNWCEIERNKTLCYVFSMFSSFFFCNMLEPARMSSFTSAVASNTGRVFCLKADTVNQRLSTRRRSNEPTLAGS